VALPIITELNFWWLVNKYLGIVANALKLAKVRLVFPSRGVYAPLVYILVTAGTEIYVNLEQWPKAALPKYVTFGKFTDDKFAQLLKQ